MSALIDRVISAGAMLLLRSAHFRKRGRAFIRELTELVHVIRFDHGKYASADFGHFHVWVVIIPFAHEAITGKPFPSNPVRAQLSISKSLSHLVNRVAVPWGVESASDVDDAAREISEGLCS